MTKIIITGSKGRMGRALIACAAHHPELEVVGQIDQGDDLAAIIERVSRMRPEDAGAIVSGLLFSHGEYLARKAAPGSTAVEL